MGTYNIYDVLDEDLFHDVHRVAGGITIVSESIHQIPHYGANKVKMTSLEIER